MDLLRDCYSSYIRPYSDRPDLLLKVKWYFVQRTDFIQNNAYVSSVYDEEPGWDGCPVGEDFASRKMRNGSIPAGTVIEKEPLGSKDQWAGSLTFAATVAKGATVTAKTCLQLRAAVHTNLETSCCPDVPVGYVWNNVYAPILTVNGVNLPMTLGPLIVNGQEIAEGSITVTPNDIRYWYALIPPDVLAALGTGWNLYQPAYLMWDGLTTVDPNCYEGVFQAYQFLELFGSNYLATIVGPFTLILTTGYDVNTNTISGTIGKDAVPDGYPADYFNQVPWTLSQTPTCSGGGGGGGQPVPSPPCRSKQIGLRVVRPDYYMATPPIVSDPKYGDVTLIECLEPLHCYKSAELPDGSYWMWLGTAKHNASNTPLSGELYFATSWEYWISLDFGSIDTNNFSSTWTGKAGNGRMFDLSVTITQMPGALAEF